jgi:hypothetical protein
LSTDLVDLLRHTYAMSTEEFGVPQMGPTHVLYALLSEAGLAKRLRESAPELRKIEVAILKKWLAGTSAQAAERESKPDRCGRPGRHDGAPRHFTHPAGPAAEL